MSVLVGGLLLGIAGSTHCVLMCGPLVAIVAPRGTRALIHHASRALSYALLGALAGFVGSAVIDAGAGRSVAALAATVLLAQAFLGWRSSAQSVAGRRVSALLSPGLRHLSRIARRHPHAAAIGTGVVNGLLPCGLVYAALMASIGLGRPAEGAVFMAAFGIGTVPLVALAAGTANLIRSRWPGLNRLAPVALVVVAVLIAVRGWSGLAVLPHAH